MDDAEREICFQCEEHGHTYDEARTLWIYNDLMRRVIADYKYHFKKEYAEFFAQSMAGLRGGWIEEKAPEVIIPVPVSRERLYKRGFNQAELIGRRLSALTGIPCDGGYLLRTRNTAPQKELKRAERIRNMARTMRVTEPGKYKRVLLLDDIYTTGATADSCSRALKDSGTREVYVLTAASAKIRD